MAEPSHSASTEVPGGEHHEATALGLNAGGWVALAMLVVFAILIWKKVPGAIAKSLDDKIAAIRSQLDEAKALREEAEALRSEYEQKSRSADAEAKAMIERAQHEAEEIVIKADAEAKALIERRTRLAEDKIAAEERSAINELRQNAAEAVGRAAVRLIAERDDPAADERLVNQTIAALPKR
jgi:F-type H+-transporting ATPase subunit b